MSEVAASAPQTSKPEAKSTGFALPQIDWSALVRSTGFKIFLAIGTVITFLFWGLLRGLPPLWSEADGYYSHGWLVPPIAAYVLLTRWDKLKELTPKPTIVPVLLLIPVVYLVWIATRSNMVLTLSVLLVATIGLSTWTVLGWPMAKLTAPATLYLFFGLPVWTLVIDRFTQPLQAISAQSAYTILGALGMDLLRTDSTTILLNNFTMNVGAPCSGLKLILSLMALVTFFVLIADLKWYANAALYLFILPFAVLMNGIRIALIGIVGNSFGSDAGHQFHDYSGYIMLAICFYVLWKVAKVLGWKG